MLVRRRDIPQIAAEAQLKPPHSTDELVLRLERLEAAIEKVVATSEGRPDARVDTILTEVRQLREAASPVAPAASIVSPQSEWVFDVKRGPYNEIQNVYARRASQLGS